jgi:hypothetical protein
VSSDGEDAVVVDRDEEDEEEAEEDEEEAEEDEEEAEEDEEDAVEDRVRCEDAEEEEV